MARCKRPRQPAAQLSHPSSSPPAQVRNLPLYKGMRAVLTDNKSVKDDFVNGCVGVIEDVYVQDGCVKLVFFRPDSYSASKPPLRVVPKEETVNGIKTVGTAKRLQFPIIPAHCVTVHRVQGSTMTGSVHVLLNTASSSRRARRMSL